MARLKENRIELCFQSASFARRAKLTGFYFLESIHLYSTQMFLRLTIVILHPNIWDFDRELPQLRCTELIKNSVSLLATTSRGNTPLQSIHLPATLPHSAHELTANLLFCLWTTLFSCKCRPANLVFNWSSIGGASCKNFPLSVARIQY